MSRDLLFMACALVSWGIGEGLFMFFMPLYLQELGADPILIGMLLGVFGVVMLVTHLPAGYLADRIGRRPLLRLAWMVGAVAAIIMAAARSLNFFVVGMLLYALTAFVSGPMNSYITAARGKWSVGRTITLVSATFNVGAILGPLLGGWIGESLGMQRTYAIAAGLFCVSTGIIFFLRPQPIEPRPADGGAWRKVLLNRRYLQYLGVVFFVMLALNLPQPLSQNFLQNERQVGLQAIGVLISARSLGIVLLNLGLGQLNARRGFLLAQVGMFGFTLLLWRGQALSWYFAGYLLMGSFQTARAFAMAQARSLVSAEHMGLAYGAVEMTLALSYILAAPLAGRLYAWQPLSIYTASLPLIGLAILITSIFSPIKAKDII